MAGKAQIYPGLYKPSGALNTSIFIMSTVVTAKATVRAVIQSGFTYGTCYIVHPYRPFSLTIMRNSECGPTFMSADNLSDPQNTGWDTNMNIPVVFRQQLLLCCPFYHHTVSPTLHCGIFLLFLHLMSDHSQYAHFLMYNGQAETRVLKVLQV